MFIETNKYDELFGRLYAYRNEVCIDIILEQGTPFYSKNVTLWLETR